MRIREEQYLQRKEQILQIALESFIKKGYFGTSTRDIAKQADISSGLMFHYFASKQELYEFLIGVGCDELELKYNEQDRPLEVFKNELEHTIQFVTANPYAAKMFVFMGGAGYNIDLISTKAAEMLRQHDIVEQSIPLIEKGQKLGEIKEGDPRTLSITFWSALQGVAEAIAFSPVPLLPKADWILDVLRR